MISRLKSFSKAVAKGTVNLPLRLVGLQVVQSKTLDTELILNKAIADIIAKKPKPKRQKIELDGSNIFFNDKAFSAAWINVQPFTMTSPERGYSLWQAIKHIADNNVPGCLVECGIWQGGSAMLMIHAIRHFGLSNRQIYLFDTFEGMSEPTDHDIDIHGREASVMMNDKIDQKDNSWMWAKASLEDVTANLKSIDADLSNISLVKGDVTETLMSTKTGPIALLRLDTDFYESTKIELIVLYNQLVANGPLIIDDYGHWQGARLAVDEFFDDQKKAGLPTPMLNAVDYTGRIGIKPTFDHFPSEARYDYTSTFEHNPDLLPLYPSVVETSSASIRWPWFRHTSPHIWRTDLRHTHRTLIGVLSVEEGLLLHNWAKQFQRKKAIEIGCHLAWSSGHIISAGLDLTIIDPALGNDIHNRHVNESLTAVQQSRNGVGQFELVAGYSPSILPTVCSGSVPFHFAFIDGWHENDAPENDAKAIIPYLAENCAVAFHDLTCPSVFRAVKFMENRGFKVKYYNTSQVMAIAYRGSVNIPNFVTDPAMPKPIYFHLQAVNFA